MTTGTAYIHAALMLDNLGVEISEERLAEVVKATGKPVDGQKISDLCRILRDKPIKSMLGTYVTTESVSIPQDTPPPVEEKKEEKAVEGLDKLFGDM
jgi:ribosomal protein L12E/L44/L45/RPP1/RPP2